MRKKDLTGNACFFVVSVGYLTAIMIRKGDRIMKYHKLFAWLTIFCFLAAMITGYEKK